ncbi:MULTISPECIES: hypothetical protein [unclassified Caballeronia]|nr:MULTISPECIES: hypothetical protein [unclassified Caballeronia]
MMLLLIDRVAAGYEVTAAVEHIIGPIPNTLNEHFCTVVMELLS